MQSGIDQADILSKHPCFSKDAHESFGRIHMPVAPVCNIQCGYCTRKYDCANESRPGVTSRVLTADEAMDRLRLILERNSRISVMGVAGPGDPLANEETFGLLRAVKSEFPDVITCISTNGLLLSERMGELIDAGVKSITVTINAHSAETASEIYKWVLYKGHLLKAGEAADLLVKNQWEGLRMAVRSGIAVKLNTIYIPGVNEHEIPVISAKAGAIGIKLMNLMPLIPQANFAHLSRPDCGMMERMRKICGIHSRQMTHCKQCRADAFGIIGEDRDMELEALNAMIGVDYCETVMS